jgi:N-acyl amino acid synthase of PEP-CTERM/exosortase system
VSKVQGQRAEISRLSISKVFRKVAGGVLSDAKGSVQSEGLTDQCIVLMSLLRAMYQASKELGIDHWQATMERSLFVMLKRQGMVFRPIGPEVNHVGVRVPYFAQISDLERTVSSKRPRVAAQFGYDGMAVQGNA